MEGVRLDAVDQAAGIADRSADRSDGILRSSQDVSFQAHYLAELAARFDAAGATLAGSSQAELKTMKLRHANELVAGLTALRRDLEKERLDLGHISPQAAESDARSLADSASAVDRLVTELYSGADIDGDRMAMERELAASFLRLESLAKGYRKENQ